MILYRILFIVTFFSISLLSSFAQQNFTMYGLLYVPQRMYANPALLPQSRINIGLPLISMLYFDFGNSGFKYTDLVQKRPQDDSLEVNFQNMLGKLKKKNYFTTSLNIDLLSFGFIVKKKNYFSFNATEKVFFRFRYPKDFAEFLINGNAPTIGETLKFDFGADFSHYREFGLNYTRIVNDKMNIGGRVKYLYGMENMRTQKTDVTLLTDPNDFALTASSDIVINTSGFDSASVANSGKKYLFGSGNKGFGLDLGASYNITEQLTLSASIVDLGYIRWKNGTQNYVSKNPGASFTYSGISLSEYIARDTTSGERTFTAVAGELLDSLQNSFEIEKTSYAYTYKLPMHIYLGGDYKTTDKHRTGVLLYAHFFDGGFYPGITISDISDYGKWFSFMLSYSIYNRSYTNVGAGFRLNIFPVQWYLACDNVFGMIFPQQAKYLNVRTGINLTFGREDKKTATKSKFDEDEKAAELQKLNLGDKDKDGVNDAIDECPDEPGTAGNNGCPEKLFALSEKGDTLMSATKNKEGKFAFSSLPSEQVKFALKSENSPAEVTILIGKDEKKIKMGNGFFYYLPKEEGQLFWIDPDGNVVMTAKNQLGMFTFEQLTPEMGAKFKLLNVADTVNAVEAQFSGKNRKLTRGAGGFFYLGVEVPTLYLINEEGKEVDMAYMNEDGFFVFKQLPSEKYYLRLAMPDDVSMPDEIKVSVAGEVIKKAVLEGDKYFRFRKLTAEDAQQLSVKEAKDVQANIKETDKTVVTKVFQNLEFDANSDKIRASSFRGLDELAILMKENSGWKLKLGGHTDNVMDDNHNLELSKKRVEAVKSQLVKKGITGDRIITKYFGERYPIADNTTAEGKQKNRRVEMLFIVSGDVKDLDETPGKK